MATAVLELERIEPEAALKDRAYDALKRAITSTNIYADDAELRIDERCLSEQIGISRTPLREALARLEQEGLVRIAPARGSISCARPSARSWK